MSNIISESGKKTAIILIGHSAAGKTTLATKICKEIGLNAYEMGYVAKGLYLNEAEVSQKMMSFIDELWLTKGKDYIAKLAINIASIDTRSTHIFVGPRNQEEIKAIKEVYAESVIVAVHASRIAREDRYKSRKNIYDIYKQEAVVLRDEYENKWGLDKSIQSADIMLRTDMITEDELIFEFAKKYLHKKNPKVENILLNKPNNLIAALQGYL